MSQKTSDFLIIGAGIVGLSIARELQLRSPKSTIVILEKENTQALHASGRNSGVMHAGFYYTPDSMKAELTRLGNAALKDFCGEHRVPFSQPGKVVVTKNEDEIPQLEELLRRGVANGVELDEISEAQLREIEPRAITHGKALWSPTTSVANPSRVADAMMHDFVARGGRVFFGEIVLSASPDRVVTSKNVWSYGHLINAAGLYADRLAKGFGASENFVVLPFLGLYRYSDSLEGTFRRLIYPVPDLRNPFLGVHLTLTAEGRVKIGPTSIPVIGREQYRLLSKLRFADIADWASNFPRFMFSKHHDVPGLIRSELPKISASHLESKAQELIPSIPTGSFTSWGKPGIRAQLLNTRSGQLEMDFMIETAEKSTHVLNAVSPGWTTSIPFAKKVVDQITHSINKN